jgi:hypothetical protein
MRITFQSDRDSPPNAPDTNFEIYSLNGANGSGQTRLTTSADNASTPVDESFDVDPARSQDGSRLVFASTRDGNFEIYSASADGSSPTRLTNNTEANDIEPAVQTQAQATAQGSLQFSAANYTVSEGTNSIDITVTRTGDATAASEVDIIGTSGTASDRSDFSIVLSTLSFAGGETSRTVTVLITDDAFLEGDETINLTLSGATNATLGTPRSAVITITDNDTAEVTTNPIDTRDFFVRQQYRDFLNRDPDAPGFAFWNGEYDRRVNACNSITNTTERGRCVIRARASISLAFFLSVEFQQTGYLVYRAYDVAFARLGTPRPARGQPVSQVALTFRDEYLFDTQTIARGIVANNAIDQTRLEANTLEFFRRFVQRPGFVARYAVSQTGNEFINALLASADVVVTDAVRAELLTLFSTGGVEGRALALRRVADLDVVFQREFNRAFVIQEYFGYLRRDPDIAGYNFWLNKLDGVSTSAMINRQNVPSDPEAIGRILRAEMIEAFIISLEYQQRFGQPTTQP